MVKVSNIKRTLFSTKAHSSEFNLMFEINSSSIFSFEHTTISVPTPNYLDTFVELVV
jgi:hypothetical protein